MKINTFLVFFAHLTQTLQSCTRIFVTTLSVDLYQLDQEDALRSFVDKTTTGKHITWDMENVNI